MLLCQCFMPSLVVTRCHVLEAAANGLHGTRGVPMTKSHELAFCASTEDFIALLFATVVDCVLVSNV